MDKSIKAVCLSLVGLFLVTGCAHIDFNSGDDHAMTYYDPKPYLFVSTTKDCVTTATVVVIPEKKKAMKFETGFGSAELSATLSNAMIASVGQKTDTKIPETITSIASLGTAAAAYKAVAPPGKQVICEPTAKLYPITDGKFGKDPAFDFPVSTKIVDVK
jgi:hypothetical protein